jgi:hypothetical protein
MPNGDISNLYLMKLMNKTNRDVPMELRLESTAGRPPANRRDRPWWLRRAAWPNPRSSSACRRAALPQSSVHIEIGVYHEGRRIKRLKTNFLGPAPARQP